MAPVSRSKKMTSKKVTPQKRKPPRRTKAHLAVLVRPELKEQIAVAAAQSGNSLTREAELRLERSFADEEVRELLGGQDMQLIALTAGRLLNGMKKELGVESCFESREAITESAAFFVSFVARLRQLAKADQIEPTGIGWEYGSLGAEYMSALGSAAQGVVKRENVSADAYERRHFQNILREAEQRMRERYPDE